MPGEFLDVAEEVLRKQQGPMRATEIADFAREWGLLHFSQGKTPHQTIKARILDDIRQSGEKSRFKRVAPGKFALRERPGEEYRSLRPFVKDFASELVLAIPARDVERAGLPQGLSAAADRVFPLLRHGIARFLRRSKAETDPAFKQVLGYTIVRYRESLWRFQRGNYTNVDTMLRGSYSIGFGGHVTPADITLESFEDQGFAGSIFRELGEELKLPDDQWELKPKTLGVINDDSSLVGRCHIAIVQEVTIRSPEVRRNERSINKLARVPIQELVHNYEDYEYWSKLCIKRFYLRAVAPACSYRFIRGRHLGRDSKILAIVGTVGSGKTQIATLLHDDFGFYQISTGALVGKLAGLPSLQSVGRATFQDGASRFIQSADGPARLARAILDSAEKSGGKFVVDGIRNMSTYEQLCRLVGQPIPIIFVQATPDDAYRFFRDREDRTISEQQFASLLAHDTEKEIRSFAHRAGLILYNYGDRDSLLEQARDAFRRRLS